MDHVVFDCEIQKTIEQCSKGWDSTDEMGISVCCLWQYQDQRMRVYGPDDVPALQERLLKADRVTSFNGIRFDYPVIWGVTKSAWLPGYPIYDQLLPKTDDILRRIWLALGLNPDVFGTRHAGWGLDNVAGSTLGKGKTGNGADAPKWYQEGKIHKVVDYCAADVAITRDLGDFIARWGYVLNGPRRLEIPAWNGGT